MDVYKELQDLDLYGVPDEMYRRIAGQSEGDLEWAIGEMIGEVDQLQRSVMGGPTKRATIGKLRSKLKELEKAEVDAAERAKVAAFSIHQREREAKRAKDVGCDAATVAHFEGLAAKAKDGKRRKVATLVGLADWSSEAAPSCHII